MDYLGFIKKYIGKDIGDKYVQISNGRDYEVIIYDNIVYRFPKNKDKTLDMKLEKQKLDIVAQEVNISIPNYTIIDDICITYPLIVGASLDTIDIGFMDTIIEDIVLFLKQLHSIPLEKFNFLDTKKEESKEDKEELKNFVNKLKYKIQLRLKNKVPDLVIKDIHQYIDKLFFEYKSTNKAFVHTDIQAKNIIYNSLSKKISGIIDFTDSRIGGMELDFCNFYDISEELLRKAIKLYKGFDDNEFFERVFFLARRGVIFEIDNNELYENNFKYILSQLKKYKFL